MLETYIHEEDAMVKTSKIKTTAQYVKIERMVYKNRT